MRLHLTVPFLIGAAWGLGASINVPSPSDIIIMIMNYLDTLGIEEKSLIIIVEVALVFLSLYIIVNFYKEVLDFFFQTGLPGIAVMIFSYIGGWHLGSKETALQGIFILLIVALGIFLFEKYAFPKII